MAPPSSSTNELFTCGIATGSAGGAGDEAAVSSAACCCTDMVAAAAAVAEMKAGSIVTSHERPTLVYSVALDPSRTHAHTSAKVGLM